MSMPNASSGNVTKPKPKPKPAPKGGKGGSGKGTQRGGASRGK